MKEKEILEKNKNIELLNSQLEKKKVNLEADNNASYIKQIETLCNEKKRLETELNVSSLT
jgi:hypothetical protein